MGPTLGYQAITVPEPMLYCNQWDSLALIPGNVYLNPQDINPYIVLKIHTFEITAISTRPKMTSHEFEALRNLSGYDLNRNKNDLNANETDFIHTSHVEKCQTFHPGFNELTHCGLATPYGKRSGSTLAHVMVCCLTAPSHYLNQCWLIISKVLWHSSEGIIMRRSEDTNQKNKIENYIF